MSGLSGDGLVAGRLVLLAGLGVAGVAGRCLVGLVPAWSRSVAAVLPFVFAGSHGEESGPMSAASFYALPVAWIQMPD